MQIGNSAIQNSSNSPRTGKWPSLVKIDELAKKFTGPDGVTDYIKLADFIENGMGQEGKDFALFLDQCCGNKDKRLTGSELERIRKKLADDPLIIDDEYAKRPAREKNWLETGLGWIFGLCGGSPW